MIQLNPEEVRSLHGPVRAMVKRLHLPFRSAVWHGASGNWAGAGTGSSIDFHDHREYQPGDDVRHIDWNAYARTGTYIMKLYREEVSPALDVVLDFSASMFVDREKACRSIELLYFCVESAMQWGASLRCTVLQGTEQLPISTDELMAHSLPSPTANSSPTGPSLEKIPWRAASLRVFISDLLFPEEPERILRPMVARRGRALLLVPYSSEEANPEWHGNVQFVDCESLLKQKHRVEPAVIRRYQGAYERHFGEWKGFCRRSSISFARVHSGVTLEQALQAEALREGAVELWG